MEGPLKGEGIRIIDGGPESTVVKTGADRTVIEISHVPSPDGGSEE